MQITLITFTICAHNIICSEITYKQTYWLLYSEIKDTYTNIPNTINYAQNSSSRIIKTIKKIKHKNNGTQQKKSRHLVDTKPKKGKLEKSEVKQIKLNHCNAIYIGQS